MKIGRVTVSARRGLILVGLALVLFWPPKSPASSQKRQVSAIHELPVIDVHAHFVGRLSVQEFPEAADAALDLMKQFGIRRMLLLPPPQLFSHYRYDYSVLQRISKMHDQKFSFLAGGAKLNAMIHRYANPREITQHVKARFAEIANALVDAGAVGFGEISGLHISARRRHPYEYVPADHPLIRILADIAAQRNVPIDLHMDGLAQPAKPPERFSQGNNPSLLPETISGLERLLIYNRGARIVWAHGGSDPLGGMNATRISDLMDRHNNLFVSLRIVGPNAPLQNKIMTDRDTLERSWRFLFSRHPDRFVIGSDSFLMPKGMRGKGPGIFFAQRNHFKLRAMRRVLSLLPQGIARKIAFENAIRVYQLQ